MRHGPISTVGALVLTLAAAAGCNSATPPAEDAAVSDEAAARADREAELERERDVAVAELNERVAKLEREFAEETADRPRGTSGTSARNLREEISEDVANAREAVDDLRSTTVDNWWARHEQALQEATDDVEEDVRRLAGRAYRPAAADRAPERTTAEAPSDRGDTAPFTSRRDQFVTQLRARVDGMKEALGRVTARGARETELEDTRARVDKLADDLDRLTSASPDDWWDITRRRVSEYLDRVESSVARLGDVKNR